MNEIALDTYWYWINERHNIYIRRNKGESWPWTEDKTLQDYKFTNVFRELDKTTIPIIIQLNVNNKQRELQIFNVCLYRIFNWTPTYTNNGGWCIRWNDKRKDDIRKYKEAGNKTFTGAYIIPNIGSPLPKIELAFKTLDMLWKDRHILTNKIISSNRIEQTVNFLRKYPMLGGFMSYEIACDLMYTPVLNDAADRYSWANPGPGAKRGLSFIFDKEFKKDDSTCIGLMNRLYLMKNKRIGNHIKKEPFPIDMRFIENGLCEFSKYWRIKELGKHGKNRYRKPRQ